MILRIVLGDFKIHPVRSSPAEVLWTRDFVASETSYGIHPYKLTGLSYLAKFYRLRNILENRAEKRGEVEASMANTAPQMVAEIRHQVHQFLITKACINVR